MSPGDTNMEAWSLRLGIERGVDSLTIQRRLWPIKDCHDKDYDDDDDVNCKI
jgi:hypothetical protein